MKYISVCSGVEAATQAWDSLGWEPVAFSEIEPFPCAVLASRFPTVPNLGDMTKITYNHETNILTNGTTDIICNGGIDLLVGGTPCQSFSVAGTRKGLEGASGLAAHYARLIGEIRPRWFVWENVPGALSSVTYGDQRDFNFLLHAFAVGGDASLGLRYNCEWRVLDTQYVRVEQFPRAIHQRRRRVFIVGHLATDGECRSQVLLEQDGLRGDTPPSRVKGKGFARGVAQGLGGAGGERIYRLDHISSNSMKSANPKSGFHEEQVSASLDTTSSDPNKNQGGMAIVSTVRSSNQYGQFVEDDIRGTLDCEHSSGVGNGTPSIVIGIQGSMVGRKDENGPQGDGVSKEVMFTQNTIDRHAVAIGVDLYNQEVTGDVSKTLNTASAQDAYHTGAVAIGISRDMFNVGANGQMSAPLDELMPAQTANGGGRFSAEMTSIGVGGDLRSAGMKMESIDPLCSRDWKEPPFVGIKQNG